MDKYEDLLERAIDQLPPEVFEHKRFKQTSKVIELSSKTLRMLQKV